MNFKGIKVLIAVLIAFAMTVPCAIAGNIESTDIQIPVISYNLLSDGQFVFGPNVGDFNIKSYLDKQSGKLSEYSAEIEFQALYASVNPKVILTILEMKNGLVTNPDPTDNALNSIGFAGNGLDSQVESLVLKLTESFYSHLYKPKNLESVSLTLKDGTNTEIPYKNINSGTYALLSALAPVSDSEEWKSLLSKKQPDGFYQTYLRLFHDDNPLDTSNIIIPSSNTKAQDDNHSNRSKRVANTQESPPPLQFPFPVGEIWHFSGTHGGHGWDLPFSSIDFSPTYPRPACGGNFNGMNVVAAGDGYIYNPNSGIFCLMYIHHGGGWVTRYYHLENTNISLSGSLISANTPFATVGCATCTGGIASAAHVHFSIMYNGAFYPIDGVVISGWTVHDGSSAYNSDSYLERNGEIWYSWGLPILNEGIITAPTSVNLSSFIAKPKKGKIKIKWRTSSEIDNLGFNILRSNSENGTYTQINDDLIKKKKNAVSGAKYKFKDRKITGGKIYYYKLEDIDSTSGSTIRGPFKVKAKKKAKKKKNKK